MLGVLQGIINGQQPDMRTVQKLHELIVSGNMSSDVSAKPNKTSYVSHANMVVLYMYHAAMQEVVLPAALCASVSPVALQLVCCTHPGVHTDSQLCARLLLLLWSGVVCLAQHACHSTLSQAALL